ncbi:uncharacterized protein LOC116292548 [Actinia tenebrosa]|uniref:Uncharacterized protein LOC116292548 n=1 Tax=Actinia tenebrosa TaxID=6105 RepID=A0A6P8HSU7_ACTTE|nr:uncharacterized protein LOC116292548 [Actinia tenebrosa]
MNGVVSDHCPVWAEFYCDRDVDKSADDADLTSCCDCNFSGATTFKPRDILSLCNRWQNWGESIPVINRELCLALARAGHRVTCLVLTSTDFDKEDARKGNVELIQCSDKPGIKRDDPQLLYGQQINCHPDLVIGHGKLTGPASVFHADNASCPRLHVIHDLPAECLKFDSLTEQQCNEEQLAKNADFVAVIGSLLKEKWSTVINRNVIELIPGLPELTTRNRIPSPQCRCFVPAKFSAPFASGLRLAIKTVDCSSKRESSPRKTTLIACNTDSNGSVKPAKKVLKDVNKSLVDLNERSSISSQEVHFDIQGATVYLSPARVEAFGVTALDAIAIGIPVIISAHSGLAYTIRQYFDEKFHSCIKDVFLDRDGANAEGEEDDDAHVWAISIDKISLYREEAFDLAGDLRSEWKKKFTWDSAVQELMHPITESGKLSLRSPRSLPNSTMMEREVPEACLNLVKGLNIFDRRQKFVLFLSPEDPQFLQNAVHLGLVQWAAVFDFDSESTTKGYLKSCESFLENTGKPACRMLPPPKEDIGKENQNFTLPNGIPWILLQGVPDMERDVDRNLDWIQEIFHHLRKRHSTNITLLIIWNSTNDNKHLCKKLYQIQLQVQASPYWKNAVQLVLLSTSDEVDSRLDDIAEEWGVKIKAININHFCNALYSTATANPLYKLDPDFSLPKRNVNGMQCDIAPATLPSSMRWVDSVLEVLYTSIGKTPEFGKVDAHYFYRGGKISWYGIEMDYAVERESWKPLQKVVEEEMEYRGATFLTLFHQRGTGGTTSARKLLYDFHLCYPCVCLKTINYETFLAIKVIWEFCSLPVIILADIKEFPGAEDNDVEALYGNLSNEKVSCLILHIVHRHYQVEPKREKEPNPKDIILAKSLTDKEKKNFIKVYSLQSPTKKSELGAMKHADEQLQIPFYYGLVAFGEQFKGLEPFVSDCLRGLNERQRRALCFLSMAHQYGQLELNLSTFAGVFNLKTRQLHSMEDVLSPESIELLIEEYGCWRPRHCTIGKEILRQLLTKPYNIHPENWQRNLADKTMEFISYTEEETSKAVLLNRISDEKTYKRFSSLVEDIPEDEDVVKVFKKAITVHPSNPFFKAHLGRYYSVRRGHEGFDLALKYTDDSILLATGMSRNIRSQLTQMKGMIFKRQVKSQIEKSANLADIVSFAKEGVAAFTRAASISPDRLENCYIPQVRMMCDIFRHIDKDFKGGIFKYLHSNDADPFILDGISESSDILESVSESIYYPDLRRDLFRLGGFGRRNKSVDKADLIQHFKEMKKTSRTSTASINRQIVLLQLELCKENNKPISEVAEELNHLLEEALKYDKKIDLTMRLWVKVAPHIPVDLQAAESKMAAWCNQGKSAMSYLYRYIFTCIRILEGGRDQRFEDDRKIARDDLHKSVHSTKRLTLLHPDRPVVFLGTAKGMGQLVTAEESVTNVRKQRLIPESLTRRLRRFTGIITKTGKVAQIKADGLTVSFRADLCQPPLIGESYQAKKVSFFLAFTYFEADAYNVKIVAE